MKLRQLLKAHFDTNGPTPMGKGIMDYILNPKLLAVYQEELEQCGEFNGSKIVIIPEVKSGKSQRVMTGYDEEGIPMYDIKFETVSPEGESIITTKLSERTKFAPVTKIFSISLGPDIFDPQDIFQTKVDTVCITPSIFDQETMKPTKRIVITFDPEVAQDGALKSLKKEIKEREKDEIKPEFTANLETDDEAKKAEIIKEHETEAQNLMGNVNHEELKNKINEKEEEYLQTIVGMVQECFRNPSKFILPTKRPILIRLTKDSLVDNVKPVLLQVDTMVTLSIR